MFQMSTLKIVESQAKLQENQGMTVSLGLQCPAVIPKNYREGEAKRA